MSLLKRSITAGNYARLGLLSALVGYFAIGIFNLGLPGLQYDEAADAVQALEILQGGHVSSISTFAWLGREWSLMMLHHIGPASIYTSLLGFTLFGVSVEALRFTQLCVGALSLLLLFQLAKAWFGVRVALIAVWACASAPAFIWWNRAGANWTAPLLPMALGMVLALTWAWRAGQSGKPVRWALILAAFLFGAGFTTKILFVWLLAPLTLTLLLAGPRRVWRCIAGDGRSRIVTLALAGVALLLGLAPFIAHNVPNGDTFRFVLSNAAQTRIYGHNNLDFGNNLLRVLSEFIPMMGGATLHFGSSFFMPVGSILWVGAIGYGGLWLRPTQRSLTRCFLWLSQVVVLPISTVSTSSIGATYVFILVPFAWLMIAVALHDVLLAIVRNPIWQARLQTVILGALVVAHLVTNIALLQFFTQTGGRGMWSDAIFALARTLEDQYARHPIRAMDWGFSRSVQLLTQKRVDIEDRFEPLARSSAKFADLCTVMLRDEPLNVYLRHTPQSAAFPAAWEMLDRTAQKLHKQLVLQQTFYERDGITNSLLYTAQNLPRQFAAPVLAAPRHAQIGADLMLLGGEAIYRPDAREVAIQLYWQALHTGLPDDTVLLHVVDQATGTVVLNADHRPIYDNYPFPNWAQGEVVTDPYWISLPPDLPAGVYQIRVGRYDRITGQRREIIDPQHDAAGNSLMLATFEVR